MCSNIMNYKITHTTKYNYSDPIAVCHNLVHLAPRDTTQQKCEYHRLTVQPQPSDRDRRSDYFGNQVEFFSIQEPHRRLSITSSSRVRVDSTTAPDLAASPAWERVAEQLRSERGFQWLDASQHCFSSDRIAVDRNLWPSHVQGPPAKGNSLPTTTVSPSPQQEFQNYARQSFAPGTKLLEAARDLTARIYTDFAFDSKATTLNTPVEVAFANRHGVCQDFAHVQIACLRSLGLAARYVSGYLRTNPPPGKPRLVGADLRTLGFPYSPASRVGSTSTPPTTSFRPPITSP